VPASRSWESPASAPVRFDEAALQDQRDLVADVAVVREADPGRHADEPGVGAGEARAGLHVDELDALGRTRRPRGRIGEELDQRARPLAADVEE